MLERDDDGNLLFPIRSNPVYFYAGHLWDVRQTLIGRSVYGHLVVACFDSGGSLIEVIHQKLPSHLIVTGPFGTCEVDEDDFLNYLQGELGFTDGRIQVKEFHLTDKQLEVYQLPEHYQAFLNDPNNPLYSQEEHESFPGLIREWHERGQFVLVWGNDYWLDITGEVIAS